jgi:rfaE bifunctional protein kinase chain/domain
LIEKIYQLLIDADVLVFEDYDKGVLTSDNIRLITDKAKASGVPVVVDPKKRNFNAYHGADLFKPNLKELKEGMKIELDDSNQKAFELAVVKLMDDMHLKNMMVTMSEKGVMISDGKTFEYIPAHLRKIADVSGAGDTVISVACLCIALGLTNKQIATLSNLAGGLVCEEVGVVPIDKNKFLEEIKELGIS